jgi:hypothetical protein
MERSPDTRLGKHHAGRGAFRCFREQNVKKAARWAAFAMIVGLSAYARGFGGQLAFGELVEPSGIEPLTSCMPF